MQTKCMYYVMCYLWTRCFSIKLRFAGILSQIVLMRNDWLLTSRIRLLVADSRSSVVAAGRASARCTRWTNTSATVTACCTHHHHSPCRSVCPQPPGKHRLIRPQPPESTQMTPNRLKFTKNIYQFFFHLSGADMYAYSIHAFASMNQDWNKSFWCLQGSTKRRHQLRTR